MLPSDLQAEVLNQALPYIQAFRGQTFVIKYGGSVMNSAEATEGVIRNVILLALVGVKPVLVHGGGPEIDRWLDRLGIETKRAQGLRVTDDDTMDVVEMALGRANKSLVAMTIACGGNAVGLSGRDGSLLLGEPISAELGRVGNIVQVNPSLLRVISEAGFIPVVSSVASDLQQGALNVNADAAAGAIAAALGASKLILLTDTNGVLTDKSDPSSTVSSLTSFDARQMVSSGAANRGMIPKLEAAIQALDDGVPAVHLINGTVPNALLIEVLTESGIGTMMVRHSG